MTTEQDKQTMKNIDAFISTLTGAGTSDDKFSSYYFVENNELDPSTLEALYTDNDIAAAIVERVVRDALRSGYELKWNGASDQERHDLREWAETEYGVTTNTQRARIYSRLFGGGGLFLGVDSDLESEAFRGMPIEFIRPVPSTEMIGDQWYGDPSQQDFGEVAIYRHKVPQFQPRTRRDQKQKYIITDVHESRLIPMYGILTTDTQRWKDKGWGKSVLHRVYDVLKKFEAAYDGTLHTLSEQSIPVYKVKALLDLLASENGELLAKRFELINAAKSSYRAIILDMEESYERVEASLNQASNVVDAAMVRVAAAAQMPVTLLFGRAPSGLNATGESDLENWNQQVASEQRLVLGPVLLELYQWLVAQPSSPVQLKKDANLEIYFPAVETPSLQDQVNLYAQRAAADKVYFDMGAATGAEIAKKRSTEEGTQFPTVNLAHLEKLDTLQKERILEPPTMDEEMTGGENETDNP